MDKENQDLSERLRSAIESITDLDLDPPTIEDIDLDELHSVLVAAWAFVRSAR